MPQIVQAAPDLLRHAIGGVRYAMLWSGGKDGALALHRARASGLDVTRLHTFYDSATGRVRFHGTRVDMIKAQAAAMGVAVVAEGTTWEEMPGRLEAKLSGLRADGFAGVVLGDIDLADVRAWYEDRVTAAGLQHVEPIWGEPPASLLDEFVASGGRAVITCVDLSRLDRSWLGRIVDERFAEQIGTTGIHPCGENGEYHSFAYDGPLFAQPVRWKPGDVREEGRFVRLDVVPAGR